MAATRRVSAMRLGVLGGGISGLTAAFRAKKLRPDAAITLIESSGRLGGWIESAQKGQFLFERGPATLRGAPAGQDTWDLIRQLDIEDEVLQPSLSAGKRYIYSGGRLQRVSLSAILREDPSVVLEAFRPRGTAGEDETVGSFLRRRIGPKLTEKFADSMVRGVYAGGLDEISVCASSPFGKMKEIEDKYGSFTAAGLVGAVRYLWGRLRRKGGAEAREGRGPPSTAYSFRNGIETLPRALAADIVQGAAPATIMLDSPVDVGSLTYSDKGVRVAAGGIDMDFDGVVCAVPPGAMAAALGEQNAASKVFGSMEQASVAVVCVGFRGGSSSAAAGSDLDGFGHLIPGSEGELALGVIWHSSVFNEGFGNAAEAQRRFTVMLGGDHIDKVLSMSERELEGAAREAIYKHLDILVPPDATIDVNVHRNAISHYQVGHSAMVRGIRDALPASVQLAGAAFDGVSVHDCVSSGLRAAEAVVAAVEAGGKDRNT